LHHVRPRGRTPSQSSVDERAFQSLEYERLYCEQNGDALNLSREVDTYRIEFNTIRLHGALA
jgi:hypothetical protein